MNGLLKLSAFILIFTFVISTGHALGDRSNADIQEIAQLVIDLKELDMYYHIDTLPQRSPLIIAKNKQTKHLKLNKFGKNVLLVEKKELLKTNKAYLEFTNINIDKNTAQVVFTYPIEGLHGKVKLKKRNSQWKIISKIITER